MTSSVACYLGYDKHVRPKWSSKKVPHLEPWSGKLLQLIGKTNRFPNLLRLNRKRRSQPWLLVGPGALGGLQMSFSQTAGRSCRNYRHEFRYKQVRLGTKTPSRRDTGNIFITINSTRMSTWVCLPTNCEVPEGPDRPAADWRRPCRKQVEPGQQAEWKPHEGMNQVL